MGLTSEQQRKVLDGAVKLALTQELSSISLDHLTKASGIPAFDIIRHYHSKENILAAVLERELRAGSRAAVPRRNPSRRAGGDGDDHAQRVPQPPPIHG